MVVKTRRAKQQQQHHQGRRQQPFRHARQQSHSTNRNTLNNAPGYDGLLHHFLLDPSIIHDLSQLVPIMTSEKYRSIRHVFTNIADKHASKELIDKIVKKINILLQQECNIDVNFLCKEGAWVLAPPINKCKSQEGGEVHRDISKRIPGYLTVLIFLGKRADEDYGGVTYYPGTQNFLPKVQTFVGNDLKKLQSRITQGEFKGEVINSIDFNCVVFDSRLIHFSHLHYLYEQRTVFSMVMNRQGVTPNTQEERTLLDDRDGYVGRIE